MILNEYEQDMLKGKHGPGKQRSMQILVKFGQAMGAEKMVPLASAHTMPKEPLELLEELTEGVNRPAIFTTLHPTMSAFCLRNWKEQGISPDFAEVEMQIHQKRQEIYKRIGFYQVYTCLPMLAGNVIKKGDFASWIGTGLQLMTNSVLGARTNRDGTVVNLASAITGRTPYYGMLVDENRKARVQIDLKKLDIINLKAADLGAIGYWVGGKVGSQNLVFSNADGLQFDQIRYLLPPLSVSGSVTIAHISGVTPEASNLEEATGGKKPLEVIEIRKRQIEEARNIFGLKELKADLAIFGCSHCSITEIRALANQLDGKKLDLEKRLWVGTGYQTHELAKTMGYAQTIEKAGGVFTSSCVATIPQCTIPDSVKTVITNSFKAAHYITNLSKGTVKVQVADMNECLNAVLKN
jgi:predicted aconitase